MKIINFGSMNQDFVYEVPSFAQQGETLQAQHRETYISGRGLNQSIALARAECPVIHVGLIGSDGVKLKECLASEGVDVSLVEQIEKKSGHTIIQREKSGKRLSINYGGANHHFTPARISKALELCEAGDVVLLQNEINGIPEILEQAKAQELIVVFNVAPTTEQVHEYPLELVDLFIINETEGHTLTGQQDPETIFKALFQRYPQAAFVLTMGELGAKYQDRNQRITVPAEKVPVVDTTAAGDAFIGFFLAHWLKGNPIESCLKIASIAASRCIGKKGAAVSIPYLSEL